MPKKKSQCKQIPKDFTLDDYANAQKPTMKVNKTPLEPEQKNLTESSPDVSWDQISDDEIDLVKEENSDGTVTCACVKVKKDVKNYKHNEYPEIIWYEISRRIHPEDIGRFSLINKITYNLTQQKSFWVEMYDKYCKPDLKLPPEMRIEDGAKAYGYRTRVIKALYYIYTPFVRKVIQLDVHDSKPHNMIKHRCINMWVTVHQITNICILYIKFRKMAQGQVKKSDLDLIDEMGRLDANPELDNKVLEITCKPFPGVHSNMLGMVLTSIKMGLSNDLCSHKLCLGFNSGAHVAKNVMPESLLTVEKVMRIRILHWWHPNYPYFVIKLPFDNRNKEDVLVKDQDFTSPECQLATGST